MTDYQLGQRCLSSLCDGIVGSDGRCTKCGAELRGSVCNMPIHKSQGWVCPLCGRANAPFMLTCQCRNGKQIEEQSDE